MRKNRIISGVGLLLLVFFVACKQKKQKTSEVKKEKTAVQVKQGVRGPGGHASAPAGAVALGQKLGLTSKEIKSSKLYSFINDWYGVPYKYGGCQKSGVDCSCFTSLLCEKVYGTTLPRSAAEMFGVCKKLELKDAREGDLVFFKLNGRTISHVGVYLRKKVFVHASTSRGVMLSSVDEAYFSKFFFRAGRPKDS